MCTNNCMDVIKRLQVPYLWESIISKGAWRRRCQQLCHLVGTRLCLFFSSFFRTVDWFVWLSQHKHECDPAEDFFFQSFWLQVRMASNHERHYVSQKMSRSQLPFLYYCFTNNHWIEQELTEQCGHLSFRECFFKLGHWLDYKIHCIINIWKHSSTNILCAGDWLQQTSTTPLGSLLVRYGWMDFWCVANKLGTTWNDIPADGRKQQESQPARIHVDAWSDNAHNIMCLN